MKKDDDDLGYEDDYEFTRPTPPDRPAPESFECGCNFQPIADEPLLSDGRASVLARWEKDPGDYAMRSCWNCNGSHEHLKKADGYPIRCFCCGHLYLDGARLSTTEAEEKR